MQEWVVRRRRWVRVHSQVPALVRKVGDAKVCRFGHLRDLSLGGGLLVWDRPIAAGDLLRLRITLRGRILSVTARAIFGHPEGQGLYCGGLEFLNLMEGDSAYLGDVVEHQMAPIPGAHGPPPF